MTGRSAPTGAPRPGREPPPEVVAVSRLPRGNQQAARAGGKSSPTSTRQAPTHTVYRAGGATAGGAGTNSTSAVRGAIRATGKPRAAARATPAARS